MLTVWLAALCMVLIGRFKILLGRWIGGKVSLWLFTVYSQVLVVRVARLLLGLPLYRQGGGYVDGEVEERVVLLRRRLAHLARHLRNTSLTMIVW